MEFWQKITLLWCCWSSGIKRAGFNSWLKPIQLSNLVLFNKNFHRFTKSLFAAHQIWLHSMKEGRHSPEQTELFFPSLFSPFSSYLILSRLLLYYNFWPCQRVGTITVTGGVLLSAYEACCVSICFLRGVEFNMQMSINEGLGYFQLELAVNSTGKINTLVLLHPSETTAGCGTSVSLQTSSCCHSFLWPGAR